MREIAVGKNHVCFVDDCDYEYLNQWKWQLGRGNAVRRSGKINKRNFSIYMHRLILNAQDDLEVDHINRNPLDNRRENLRLATRSQNAKNRRRVSNISGYPGIKFEHQIKAEVVQGRIVRRSWAAHLRCDGKWINLGRYETAKEAHEAYLRGIEKYHGEFGNTEKTG